MNVGIAATVSVASGPISTVNAPVAVSPPSEMKITLKEVSPRADAARSSTGSTVKVQPSSVSLGVLRITEVSFAVSTPKASEHETVQKASSVTYRRASISKVRLLAKAKLAGAVKATSETGTISMATVSC